MLSNVVGLIDEEVVLTSAAQVIRHRTVRRRSWQPARRRRLGLGSAWIEFTSEQDAPARLQRGKVPARTNPLRATTRTDAR